MAIAMNHEGKCLFEVVHPLFDKPEEKCRPEGLPPIHMSKVGKFSLIALRGYLVLMFLLLIFRFLTMAGSFTQLVGH
ncbi:MAG: hypothetical protein M1319_01125 [Chloroflexi bacterium]|nr:hypothetical protein [Chloroflexota bacterium]